MRATFTSSAFGMISSNLATFCLASAKFRILYCCNSSVNAEFSKASLNEDTLEAWEIALKDWKGVDSFWESVGDVKKQEGGLEVSIA